MLNFGFCHFVTFWLRISLIACMAQQVALADCGWLKVCRTCRCVALGPLRGSEAQRLAVNQNFCKLLRNLCQALGQGSFAATWWGKAGDSDSACLFQQAFRCSFSQVYYARMLQLLPLEATPCFSRQQWLSCNVANVVVGQLMAPKSKAIELFVLCLHICHFQPAGFVTKL